MIEFTRLVVGPLDTNCYIIWDNSTRKAAIIDPGGDKDLILQTIQKLGVNVERILLTHGHPDHVFHASHFAALYNARVGMHEADIVQHEAVHAVAKLFYDISEDVKITPNDFFVDEDELVLGESKIKVLHTPGHSEGGLCYVTDAGVFCGDTIFAQAIGRTDFPGGSYETLIRSIKEKLLTLDDATPLYTGHGPATSVGAERRNNPFLQ